MPGLAGNFKYQAIRKTQCLLCAEMDQCRSHGVSVLQHQTFMCQQQFKRRYQLHRCALVDRLQNPYRFRQYQM